MWPTPEILGLKQLARPSVEASKATYATEEAEVLAKRALSKWRLKRGRLAWARETKVKAARCTDWGADRKDCRFLPLFHRYV
jgi:hypothetical protein